MKRTVQKILPLGLLGALALGPGHAWAKQQGINCDTNVNITPTDLQNGVPSCAGACGEQDKWILAKIKDYTEAVRSSCQHTQQIMNNAGTTTQQNSQGTANKIQTDASSAMGNVIQKGNQIKGETAAKVKTALGTLERQHPNARSAIQEVKAEFNSKDAFDPQSMSQNRLSGVSEVAPQSKFVKNSADFMHLLAADVKKRQEAKDKLDTMAGQTEGNNDKSGASKDGKGMDPSALMGPLAALAGMAQKKNEDPAAASDLSNAAAGASTTPPAEAKLGNSVVKASNLADSGAKGNTGNSTTLTPGAGDHAGEGAAAGSQYGSSLSSGPYKDAFTGYGANGTTPGTFSPSGGGAGSAGAAASGEGERNTASTAHSPSEEEALSSFGGGGLNFAGSGGGGSSSSHAAESEGVKDFLQDAETNLSDGAFDEAGSENSAEASGVEGEDGTELFRRVRSALERSQRKGAVLSGLSGPKDPRFR